MKQLLLLSLVTCAVSLTISAESSQFQSVSMLPKAHKTIIPATTGKTENAPVRKAAPALRTDNTINPLIKKSMPKRAATNGTAALFESFEAYDGTSEGWIPDGWTTESLGSNELTAKQKWNAFSQPNYYFPAPTDGIYYINLSVAGGDKLQDEKLISPIFTVEEKMTLSFDMYTACMYYYDWAYYNPDEMVFTQFEAKGDIKVLIREEGANEWTPIYSMTDDNAGKAAYDMIGGSGVLEPVTVSLDGYEGKNVQIAFHYYGTDCDSAILDNIAVDYPGIDIPPYLEPYETLFYGFSSEQGWTVNITPIAMLPVYADLMWINDPFGMAEFPEGTTCAWTYQDPATGEMTVSDSDPDFLLLKYAPNYSTESTTRHNLVAPPTISASAPQYKESVYAPTYNYIQIGGSTEVMFNDGSAEVYGLLPFDPITQGITEVLAAREYGSANIPVFGRGEGVSDFWTKYTFDDEASEENFVTLDAILNFIYPSASPLVVSKAHLLAMGKISPEAEFTIEILAMANDYVIEGAPVVASAVCKGTDVVTYEFGSSDYLTIPFNFDTPVVLDQSNIAYAARITGFNGKGVELFSPMIGEYPHTYLCHGWIEKTITREGNPRKTWSAIANISNEYGDLMSGFAINLVGEYPWLTSEVTDIAVPSDGTPLEIALSSYYDGSRFTVDAPAGVTASVSGRYGNTVLNVRHNDTEVIAEGTLTLNAPGVELSFNITEFAGVNDLIAAPADAVPVEYFTPDGRRINESAATEGIFIVRYSDGSVRKINR